MISASLPPSFSSKQIESREKDSKKALDKKYQPYRCFFSSCVNSDTNIHIQCSFVSHVVIPTNIMEKSFSLGKVPVLTQKRPDKDGSYSKGWIPGDLRLGDPTWNSSRTISRVLIIIFYSYL